MSYFLKSSNLSSIQSAIEEFKQVILVQNQVITNLQTALNASLLRVDALETTTASNTTAITANTTNIATGVNELAATNRTVLSNTQNLSTTMNDVGIMELVVSNHTTSLATLQSQVATITSDISTKTTEIAVLDSIQVGHGISIANSSNEIFRLNGISLSHTTDLSAKTSQIAVINSIQAGHTTSIGVNYNEIFRLNGVSLNHTTLLAGLRTDLDAVGSVSDSDITNLQNDVSTINSTLTAHDGRIFTNTTDVFQLQTNGHEGRITSAEATVLTLVTDVGANTTLVNNLLLGLQIFGRSITAVEADIRILNTTIDSNLIRLGSLETTQITHDGLIREFDQEFNDPATGVIFKLDTLTTTYTTHIDGAFLTIRQNVDDNNAILGTLSTHTTSLLTAMSQLVPRVEDLEAYHP
jgi:hypothetical protein